MSTTTAKCALFLSPAEKDFIITDPEEFIGKLQDIGLIAEKLPDQINAFYTGQRYLDHIAYMGCSPAIQFEASKKSNDFCHVIIHHYDKPELLVSQTQTRAPHCPNCSKPIKDWQDMLTDDTINCGLCHTVSNFGELNWRKMAGYARVFIEITDIFPKEATPQQTLLKLLSDACDTEWLYFYNCH